MKLEKIEIVSYRSVSDQVIPMNETCIGLVGLNESGKTNILSAIRLLDPSFVPTIKDRSKLNNSLPRVIFTFQISAAMNEQAIQHCKAAISDSQTLAYHSIANKLSIRRYSAIRQLEQVKDLHKKVSRYICDFSLKTEGFMKPKEKEISLIPTDTSVTIDNKKYLLSKLHFVSKNDIPDLLLAHFEPATEEYVKKFFGLHLIPFLEGKLPQVVYWQYDQQYLLPSEITYSAFLSDDDPYSNCAPLYNIMLLSNRLEIRNSEDLISKISEWKNDASLRRRDANIITEGVNQYIARIWPDFDQRVHIDLEEMKITVHIHDPKSQVGSFYEMESRSQGFKTFISFMLTISAEIDTDQVSNSILLLDEPETHLHPSGAKFMREELLKLSENNYVFYATHSIFMIDRSNIRRHLIVKKESEATKVSFVDRNNFIQESVIYEALGTTVDEFSIRRKNIIFEGRMDLLLFEYLVNHCLSKKGNPILDYELHDAGGTKNIVMFFKNKAIPRDSEWVIVLDNDSAGRFVPSEISRCNLGARDIDCVFYSQENGVELEDLLPDVLIQSAIASTEEKLQYSAKFSFVLDPNKVVSKCVDEYKHRNNLESTPLFEATFKESLTSLVQKNIDEISDSTIKKRLDSFKAMFPKYFNSIRPLLERKGVKLG